MHIPIELLLDKAAGSRFKLVILAARRAAEIQAGQPLFLEIPESKQPTSIALEEIAAGKVQWKLIT